MLSTLYKGFMLKNYQKAIECDKFVNHDSKIRTRTRLSNNNVENWFKILKHNILQSRKDNYFSEIVRPILNNLVAKYNRYYKPISNRKKKEIDSILMQNEVWGDSASKKRSGKKNKNFYYQSTTGKAINTPESERMILNRNIIKKNISFFENFKMINNGETCTIKKTKHVTENTCSIDYFLLIVSCLYQNNVFFNQSENSLSHVFRQINMHIKKKKWNLARLEWLKVISSVVISKRKDRIIYNFFGSEYDAFYATYSKLQEYKWKSECSNPKCIYHKMIQTSCYFLLK